MDINEDYILSHITPEDPYLHQLYRATHLHLLRPGMASGHLQGSFLHMLTALIQPENVLEIGTFSGYATLSIASALPPKGRILTYEINDEQELFTRPWFENSPYSQQIEFVIGDALELLPQRKETFQMAYIDGNKRHYCAYFKTVFPMMSPGGLLIFDNTLWYGRAADPTFQDQQTQGIRQFNDLVAQDPRIETVILPLRDGLTLLRKKP